MSWLKWFQGSTKWTLKSASRSAAEPPGDGGLHFQTDAKGNLIYSYLYIILSFESTPGESIFREFTITKNNGEKVGDLFGYRRNGTEVTLVFKGNWTHPETMSLRGFDQVCEIGNISDMALLPT